MSGYPGPGPLESRTSATSRGIEESSGHVLQLELDVPHTILCKEGEIEREKNKKAYWVDVRHLHYEI